MNTFHIAEQFYLNLDSNKKPLKIISGALHYFRIARSHWSHSLHNLKAMGCNTVETYVPWNLHEKHQDQFNFSGDLDLSEFIHQAQSTGLWVILRPSVYICAEWEFGGLPYWILKDKNLRVRSSDPNFMSLVDNYYSVLFKEIANLQINHGGPIILMQIENEYGSFGNNKDYLVQTKNLMRKHGVTVPLCTSDGAWHEVLEAGTLPDKDVLITGNFGSLAQKNFDYMETFQQEKERKEPLMCMEFWNGWFNLWGRKIIRRNTSDVVKEAEEILKRGSINFYMFQGGTNWGFMNGSSTPEQTEIPQITSYDYDAPLTEWGDPTEKYFALRKLIHQIEPPSEIIEPQILDKKFFGSFKANKQISLFDVLEQISTKIEADYPLTMEQLDQGYGYILYRAKVRNKFPIKACRVVDAGDRVQIFCNRKHLATQHYNNIGLPFSIESGEQIIDLLIENWGRINYGPLLWAPTQRKGLRGGLQIDLHLHSGYEHFRLPMDNLDKIDWKLTSACKTTTEPSFTQFLFELKEVADTFLDCRKLKKGFVTLNGFNLGRYWDKGPTGYLYIPSSILNIGKNELIIFDSEGTEIQEISLLAHPVFIETREPV